MYTPWTTTQISKNILEECFRILKESVTDINKELAFYRGMEQSFSSGSCPVVNLANNKNFYAPISS